MKKIIFVLIAALSLSSVQSKAQTWGSVISGSTGSDLITFLQQRSTAGSFTQVPGAGTTGSAETTYANQFQLLDGGNPFTTTYVDANSGNTITNYFFAFSWWNVRYYYVVSTSTAAGTGDISQYGRTYYASAGNMNTYNNAISGISAQMTAPTQNVPIDGGVSLLLGAGAVAHLRRKKLMSKLKNA
jgi:hypothetical protein